MLKLFLWKKKTTPLPTTTTHIKKIHDIKILNRSASSSASISNAKDRNNNLDILQFTIEGMYCASCVNTIESAIKYQLEGVQQVDINLATGKAFVYVSKGSSLISNKIPEIVDEIGYKATPIEFKTLSSSLIDSNKILFQKMIQKEQRKVIGSVGLTMPIIALHMAHDYIHCNVQPSLEKLLSFPLPESWMHWTQFALSIPIIGIFGREFFTRAYGLAKKFQSTMDTLIAMGTGTAFVYSALNTYFGWNKDTVFFESATVIISLVLLGKFLENRAKWKANDAVQGLIAMQPLTANKIFSNGQVLNVPIENLSKDDLILVKPGERVPLDGIITIEAPTTQTSETQISLDSTNYELDESMLTGESIPAIKKVGSQVYAGTINIKQGTRQQSLVLKSIGDANNTVLSRIISMVEIAQSSKAPVQRVADKVSTVFVPTILTLSGLTAAGWLLLGFPFAKAIEACVSVLVIACPCALGLATPTAIQAATGNAASKGILVKNASSLEKAKEVEILVFDKTGTLTKGKPNVTNFVNTSDGTFTDTEIIAMISSVEIQSQHPVSQALVQFAYNKGIKPIHIQSNSGDHIETFIGKGNRGVIKGQSVIAGNRDFLRENGIEIKDQELIENFLSEGKTIIYVAINSKMAGIFGLFDEVREEVKKAIDSCIQMGITPVLASGDRISVVAKVASQLGIKEFYGEFSPEQKLELIKKYQQKNKVVGMVGDGINDAPALSLADVSFALSTESSAAIAVDAADIALMKGDIKHVVDTILLSRKTLKIIHQNLFWAFAYNVAAIPLAAFGYLRPEIASFAMAMSSISVVGNSLRLRSSQSVRKVNKKEKSKEDIPPV